MSRCVSHFEYLWPEERTFSEAGHVTLKCAAVLVISLIVMIKYLTLKIEGFVWLTV